MIFGALKGQHYLITYFQTMSFPLVAFSHSLQKSCRRHQQSKLHQVNMKKNHTCNFVLRLFLRRLPSLRITLFSDCKNVINVESKDCCYIFIDCDICFFLPCVFLKRAYQLQQ